MLVIAQFLFTLPTHNKMTFFITFPFTKVFYDLGIPVEQCEPLGHKNGSLKLQNAQHDDSDRYQKRKKSKFIQSLNQQPGRVVSTASYSQPY